MSMPFAVLLLRSVYEAADSLDFIAMDQYQKEFWKLRQREYEPFLERCKPLPVRQGDLTDPLYFDFISFAQFATLNEEMRYGKQTFQEWCEECEDQQRTIQRSAELRDNQSLAPALLQRAGDAIYAGLQSGFRGETYDVPQPCPTGASLDELASCVQGVLDVFVSKGYAQKAQVSCVNCHRDEHSIEWHGAGAGGGAFTVHLERPSTLWGLGRLNGGSSVAPAFDALTVAAYLRTCHCQASWSIKQRANGVDETWEVHA
ncbi:hypothetical protein WJX73_010418 [Symbiochloris irregularis]|uniref:Uncharacterized protein n=1 Tax=Symbiochloris irregularis TaxID=706552 RepID=A0AAW1NU44_9CHLO